MPDSRRDTLPAVAIDLACTSRALRASFEIRYFCTESGVRIILHTMDGATVAYEHAWSDSLGDFFRDVFTRIDRMEALPARIAS